MQVYTVVVGDKFKGVLRQQPRLEDEMARLLVEREPGDVNGTPADGQVVPRSPRTTSALTVNHHVVRLRRYFFCIGRFCPVIKNHEAKLDEADNCHEAEAEASFWASRPMPGRGLNIPDKIT